jgi:phenylacetate-CoA ligase
MRDMTAKEVASLGLGLLGTGRALKKAPYLSRDEIAFRQFDAMRRIVAHAYDKTPFYRKLYSAAGFQPGDLKTREDFLKLPIVDKDAVIANYPDNILDRDADREKLIISRSSGSSGKVLDIAYDSQAMSLYILAGLRLYQMGFAYKPWHRQLYIYTSPYPLNSLMGLYPLEFIPTLAPVREIIDKMISFKPDLLVCYPSHLRQIAQDMTPQDLKRIRLKCISVNSEMSTQQERDALKNIFGCPVLDEYSSEELTRIAAQCLHGNYHIFEDINYLETVDERDAPAAGQGFIVGTNLHNTAMPMIRYRQNDIGVISGESCPCGRNFRLLRNLQGRRNDSFTFPSGKTLSSGFLLDASYDMLLTYRTAVKDFCLIQDKKDAVRLQVVPDTGWTPETEAAVSKKFQSFFEPGVSFAIEKVQVCEKTRTGKRNPIISYVGRQQAAPTQGQIS